MCGIVTLVQSFEPGATFDPAPVERGLAALGQWDVRASDAAQRLTAIARDLEPVSRALVGWGGFRALRADVPLAGRVRLLG